MTLLPSHPAVKIDYIPPPHLSPLPSRQPTNQPTAPIHAALLQVPSSPCKGRAPTTRQCTVPPSPPRGVRRRRRRAAAAATATGAAAAAEGRGLHPLAQTAEGQTRRLLPLAPEPPPSPPRRFTLLGRSGETTRRAQWRAAATGRAPMPRGWRAAAAVAVAAETTTATGWRGLRAVWAVSAAG